jgi:hypothetical protein
VDDAKFRRLTAHIQIVHQSDALANESEAATGISISGPIFKSYLQINSSCRVVLGSRNYLPV